MADQSRKRAENTLAALAMVSTLIGATATSSPAAASDGLARVLAPVVVGAAIYYGLTHSQRAHYYDRSYHFDPAYYYFDEHRRHWRARSHQRRHQARGHRRADRRADRHNDRRYYSRDRGRDRGHDRGHDGRGRRDSRDRHGH